MRGLLGRSSGERGLHLLQTSDHGGVQHLVAHGDADAADQLGPDHHRRVELAAEAAPRIALLQAGADKVSINSAAVRRPELINELAQTFGSQCVVVAVDARQHDDGIWYVYLNGGRIPTELQALDWAKEAAQRGAGEILLTSMNHDGMKTGFALDITREISTSVPIPVIASGGAGAKEHFKEVFESGKADAALAASIFHFGEIPVPVLMAYLKEEGIVVRSPEQSPES